MRRKKILILPILRDRKGDVNKKWYVEISQRNPQTDVMVRRHFEMFGNESINSYHTSAERYEFAKKIIDDLNEKLKSGWTILDGDERVIYEDQTQYASEARIFKKQVASNKIYVYWCSRYISEVLRNSQLRTGTIITYESRYRVFRNWLIYKNLSNLDIVAINNNLSSM
jgi:hypothetical protein